MAIGIFELLYTPPALSWNIMPAFDTAGMTRCAIEISWNLVASQTSSWFVVNGTNDATLAANPSLITAHCELIVTANLGQTGPYQASIAGGSPGSGMIYLKNMPRYCTVAGSILGSPGTCSIRVFGD